MYPVISAKDLASAGLLVQIDAPGPALRQGERIARRDIEERRTQNIHVEERGSPRRQRLGVGNGSPADEATASGTELVAARKRRKVELRGIAASPCIETVGPAANDDAFPRQFEGA